MQFIRDIYAAKRAANQPVISFEFFPPKTDEGDRNLLEKHIPALLAGPAGFCSVTYGAGGSTRDKTLMIVDRIQRQHGLTALAHLTCVNHTRDEVRACSKKSARSAAKTFSPCAAIRPAAANSSPTPGGFEFAAQLVKFIRESGDFSTASPVFPKATSPARKANTPTGGI
jgi:methylenetetrahydrofolate reductase (NADPH)